MLLNVNFSDIIGIDLVLGAGMPDQVGHEGRDAGMREGVEYDGRDCRSSRQ